MYENICEILVDYGTNLNTIWYFFNTCIPFWHHVSALYKYTICTVHCTATIQWLIVFQDCRQMMDLFAKECTVCTSCAEI